MNSIDQLVQNFENQDMGDALETMPEVDFEVDLERRQHLVALDEDVVDKLDKAARLRNVASEVFVNSLLRRKLAEAS